jgi:radical SAM-linked protein
MRVRTKYEKGDPVRFLGHLDVARVIQIAVFRAKWPIEMSQGFSPRPRLSFYAPLPAGTAGTEEYFDAQLRAPWGLPGLARSLSESLPGGFWLHEVRGIPDKEESLEQRIVASRYSIDVKGVDAGALSRSLDAFLAKQEVFFDVVRPKETRTVDLRPFVLEVGETRAESGDRAVLEMTLKHDAGRTIRPQWVLGSLSRFGLDLDPREAIIDRRKILFGQREDRRDTGPQAKTPQAVAPQAEEPQGPGRGAESRER